MELGPAKHQAAFSVEPVNPLWECICVYATACSFLSRDSSRKSEPVDNGVFSVYWREIKAMEYNL